MFNLQVFGEEKREAPTPRRRMLARQRGQVFQSGDFVSAVSLLAGVTAIRVSLPGVCAQVAALAKTTWGSPALADMTVADVMALAAGCGVLTAKMVALVVAAVLTVGVAASVAQTGAVFTAEPLAPRLDRLNPFAGLQRLFSRRALLEAVKSSLKVAIVGYVAWTSLRGDWEHLARLSMIGPVEAAGRVGGFSIAMFNRTCLGLVFLGGADLAYQWWEHEMSLRMTRQELKEEIKETEGRPEVKARIRSIQRQMAARRMMHEVKKADVVVTNPTHYAVALKYEPGKMAAPLVVAKGVDLVAQRIRREAEKHNVAVVRNQPLAQALYKMVDIGRAIPPELYQAVAEVLAFVYRLRARVVHQ
ncbi:MAG: flagellar biosynthesis protein FlhB [Ignavibacteriales bacterium]